MLEVRLLGQFDVRRDGAPILIPSRPAQALFAYLILNAGTTYRREKLAGLLWPDTTEANARSYLRHELWRVRKAIQTDKPLPRKYLSVDEISIGFDANTEFWLDASILTKANADASVGDLITGLSLYRGELLPGFYDDWVLLERERLQAVFEQKMARLMGRLIEERRWGEAQEWGERWIALGQTPEPAYRALMTAHSASGDVSKVAAVYQRAVEALHSDLGVEPSEQTRALYERLVRGGDLADLGAQAKNLSLRPPPTAGTGHSPPTAPDELIPPHVSTVPPRLTNLPVPLTSFVGREQEIAEVKRLLSSRRLVTLTGAGGSGKTRLAIEVATDLVDKFEDGVWWVELAALTDPGLVPQSLAKALGVHEAPNQPLSETVSNYLYSKRMLLVLDNCEHLVEACAHLAEQLLSACSNLKILATSREALGLTGEYVWQVPTLLLPDANQLPLPQLLARYEGIQLFVERAMAVKPGFEMTTRNASAVAQVCRRLDGIPLAIELAAARVRVLAPQEIAVRLDDRFALLTTGSRTALPRHQTLRATMDWSHDLLVAPERILFRRLAVFAGGFTLEAAEAVCAGADVEQVQVFEILTHLVDKSLVMLDVTYQGGAETRYRMLETIREYAREKLAEANEGDVVRDSHLRFFSKLAEQAEPMLIFDEVTWFNRLDAEFDNLRAAIQWSIESSDGAIVERVQSGLLAAGALSHFFLAFRLEALELLKQILSSPAAKPRTIARAKALSAAGFTEWVAGNLGQAQPLLEEALAVANELGDKLTIAWALVYLGAVTNFREDYAAAPAFLEEALAISRELGVEGKILRGNALVFLGDAQFRLGDYRQARMLYAESVDVLRELQNKNMLAYPLRRLGYVELHEGNSAKATALFKESLTLNQEVGHHLGTTACLASLAAIIGVRGEVAHAVRLFGAVETSLNTIKYPLFSPDDLEYRHNLAAVRAQLDEATFNAAWAEGQAITLEQAVEFALEKLGK